jgi:hypothetical protein
VPGYVLDGGVWKEPQVIYAMDAGVWKEVTTGEETMPASTPIGTVIRGGAYAGNVTLAGKTYGLIVGDSNYQERALYWSEADGTHPSNNFDGKANTEALLNNVSGNTDNYAAEFCASRRQAGYYDWYLPSIGELATIITNNASIPSPYKLTFSSGAYVGYLTSTQDSSTTVLTRNSANGQLAVTKTTDLRVARAVRRVLLA